MRYAHTPNVLFVVFDLFFGNRYTSYMPALIWNRIRHFKMRNGGGPVRKLDLGRNSIRVGSSPYWSQEKMVIEEGEKEFIGVRNPILYV